MCIFRMKNTIVPILLFAFFAVSLESFSQNKIEQSKGELKNSFKSDKHHHRDRSQSSSSFESDDSFQSMIIGGIAEGFLFITVYSAIGNYAGENHLHSNLTYYPYYNTRSGNYENPDSAFSSLRLFRFDIEDRFLFNSEDLYGNHLKLKIRPFQYFYLQGDYFQLTEFNKIFRDNSNLSLFSFNLCYDRIRFERFNFGWTLGANYIGNDVNKAGFCYGLNTDLFIARNISLFSSMKWSMINDAWVNELEIQGKYHLKKYFFSAGFEHLKIGTPNYDFLSIGAGIYL